MIFNTLRKDKNGNFNNNNRKAILSCIDFTRQAKGLADRTVAEIYGVETRRINEAVARNPEKFPEDFYWNSRMSQIATSSITSNIPE